MNNSIEVLLVDDHAVVRAGFQLLLSSVDGIDVIAEADRGERACKLYEDKQPDVVVMDLSMPGIGGLETIRRLCNRDGKAKILVFSIHDEMVYVSRALQAGAKGYITKSSAPEILVEAVRHIAAGKAYIESGLIKSTSVQNDLSEHKSKIGTLSVREFDIFKLLAKGLTTREIADELCLGNKTVANYSTQIKSKLKVGTLAELAHIAIVSGVIKT